MKKTLLYAFFLMGFTSIIAQVVLMRELLVVFYGNELSLGIILGNWLILIATGSYITILILKRFIKTNESRIIFFIFMEILIAFIFPLQIYVSRILRNIVMVPMGELIDFITIFASSFLILIPSCIILGLQFSLGSRIYSDITKESSKCIGNVYILESIGSFIAGITFSYLFVDILSPFQMAFLISILSLFAGLFLSKEIKTKKIGIFISILIIIGILFILPVTSGYIERTTREMQWKNNNLIESIDSIYGNIAVLEKDREYIFYENGVLMFTTEESELNEELIHFPLLEHGNPKTILLVGGGISRNINEVLKHPVERVVYVELDPKIIETVRMYLSTTDRKAIDDPRVEINYTDARFFIKRTKNKYDVIILNIPEPESIQLNRYYTIEFLSEIKKILNNNSIISINIPYSESYASNEMRILISSIYRTINSSFPDVKIIPGLHLLILASPSKNVLTYNATILSERLIDRNISTSLINRQYIKYKLSPNRIDFALNSIIPNIQINSDFRPIATYYQMLLWGEEINLENEIKSIILSFPTPIIFIIIIILIHAVIITSILSKKGKKGFILYNVPNIILSGVILTTGFAGMVFEIISIIAFQAIYGYLYYKIAVIIALFMAGLASGAYIMNKCKGDNTLRNIKILELSVVIYSLILPFIFIFISIHSYNINVPELLFSTIMLFAGFLVGAEFPLASRLYFETDRSIEKTAGVLYASDLIGAFIGAILTSSFLIPLYGITNVLILSTILNLSTLLLLLLFSLKINKKSNNSPL